MQLVNLSQPLKIEKVAEKRSFNSAKFLDFDKEKVQVLTLDQLAKTHKEDDVNGNPLKGIYHFELLEQLQEAASKHGLNTEIYDLFAANNSDKNNPGVSLLPQIESQYGKQAIEAHILRRVYANIRITDYDTPDYTTNLSVSFHQKGIQVGLGTNVIICHNQCMLGNKEFYLATYSDGYPFTDRQRHTFPTAKEIVGIVDGWFDKLEESLETERKRIEAWKAKLLSDEELIQMLGLLHCARVQHDTRIKEIRNNSSNYPLSQTQLNIFTEGVMKKRVTDGVISMWDVYNIATDLYKGDSMEIPNILPQNAAMVNFIEQNYSL